MVMVSSQRVRARTGSVFTQTDTLSYSYNDRSEVTGAVSDEIQSYNYAYAFDNIGNRINSTEDTTEKLYTSNPLNQYSSISNPSVSPTYDADGNLLSDGDWSYSWDMENRLISAENATTRLEFQYDFMSRRIEKKVYEDSVLTKHIKFLYRGYKLIEERDGLNNDAPLRRYTWQPTALDAPLYVKDLAQDTIYYYHTDANKNVTELTDSTGAVVAHYEYSPFGATLVSTGTYATDNPFRFSSEYHDDETNLVYYNYRYYSPALGRWLSRDPIAENGGLNLYGMAQNNPIQFSDVAGFITVSAIGPFLPVFIPPSQGDPQMGKRVKGWELVASGPIEITKYLGFFVLNYSDPPGASYEEGTSRIYMGADHYKKYQNGNTTYKSALIHELYVAIQFLHFSTSEDRNSAIQRAAGVTPRYTGSHNYAMLLEFGELARAGLLNTMKAKEKVTTIAHRPDTHFSKRFKNSLSMLDAAYDFVVACECGDFPEYEKLDILPLESIFYNTTWNKFKLSYRSVLDCKDKKVGGFAEIKLYKYATIPMGQMDNLA